MTKRKNPIAWGGVTLLLVAVLLIGCTAPVTPSDPGIEPPGGIVTPPDPGLPPTGEEDEPPEDPATPTSLTLSGMKTQFAFGEAFSAAGLVVTVTMSDGSTRTAASGEYTCDASAYRKDIAGEYTITVKLTGTNLAKQYTVSVEEEPVYRWDDDGVLQILAIGNSFSDDMMQYVWDIATAAGIPNVYLGTLYIGGCSLDTHVSNAADDRAAYEYRVNSNGTWSTTQSYKMGDAIAERDWDFVTLQQASGSSGLADTYGGLETLIEYVQNKLPETAHAKLAWHMTWAYQQNSTHADFGKYDRDQTTMYRSIVSAVNERIVPCGDFAAIVPNGTAVQNARTSFVGDTLTRDGYHLTYDLGRYIAGLTLMETLIGLPNDGVSFAPVGVDGYYKSLAIESAKNAVRTPFSVTDSQFDVETVFGFDAADYDVLEYTLTQGFYNATDKNNVYKIITADANLSHKFYATERFTVDTLPVGSLIVLQAGWTYRPEAWTKNVVQTARPAETTMRLVEVTLEWWSGYTYRAFNIAKVGRPNIEGQAQAVREAFTVYIPKTPVAIDDAYFAAKGYKKLDCELSQGFWASNDDINHSTLITDNASLSPKFFATKRFTQAELPVGAVLVIASGWNYRPDRWVRDGEKQTSRPDTVTAPYTVITESWWTGYTLKAFNIGNGQVLTGKEDEVKRAFSIWLPTAQA